MSISFYIKCQESSGRLVPGDIVTQFLNQSDLNWLREPDDRMVNSGFLNGITDLIDTELQEIWTGSLLYFILDITCTLASEGGQVSSVIGGESQGWFTAGYPERELFFRLTSLGSKGFAEIEELTDLNPSKRAEIIEIFFGLVKSVRDQKKSEELAEDGETYDTQEGGSRESTTLASLMSGHNSREPSVETDAGPQTPSEVFGPIYELPDDASL